VGLALKSSIGRLARWSSRHLETTLGLGRSEHL
jgi:hypothetical protein